MTVTVYHQVLDVDTLPRQALIGRIRAMLNAAEGGEDVVTLEFGSLQLDIDYDSGEISLYKLSPADAGLPVTWLDITKGSNWKNKKNGKVCIVNTAPRTKHGIVELIHQSGAHTTKQVHYFLYDYCPLIN